MMVLLTATAAAAAVSHWRVWFVICFSLSRSFPCYRW